MAGIDLYTGEALDTEQMAMIAERQAIKARYLADLRQDRTAEHAGRFAYVGVQLGHELQTANLMRTIRNALAETADTAGLSGRLEAQALLMSIVGGLDKAIHEMYGPVSVPIKMVPEDALDVAETPVADLVASTSVETPAYAAPDDEQADLARRFAAGDTEGLSTEPAVSPEPASNALHRAAQARRAEKVAKKGLPMR